MNEKINVEELSFEENEKANKSVLLKFIKFFDRTPNYQNYNLESSNFDEIFC